MRDYFQEYTKAQDALFQNKMQCIQDHIHHYEILEKLFGFQYWLNGEITNFVNKQKLHHDYIIKHLAELATHVLFSYNVLSLDVAFKIMEQNLIHQAAVNVRTVYEAIPKMYYISFFPSETRLITLKENLEGKTSDERQQYVQTETANKIMDGKIPADVKDFVSKLGEKYSPGWFRKQLYTQTTIKKLHGMYGTLSQSTHANIMRNRIDSNYSEVNTKQLFDIIHCLSYFNIHAEINGNEEVLKECDVYDESVSFMMSIGDEIKYLTDGAYMFPDNELVINKLRLPPEKQPWIKNKQFENY